jgi:hypothetical protein
MNLFAIPNPLPAIRGPFLPISMSFLPICTLKLTGGGGVGGGGPMR